MLLVGTSDRGQLFGRGTPGALRFQMRGDRLIVHAFHFVGKGEPDVGGRCVGIQLDGIPTLIDGLIELVGEIEQISGALICRQGSGVKFERPSHFSKPLLPPAHGHEKDRVYNMCGYAVRILLNRLRKFFLGLRPI